MDSDKLIFGGIAGATLLVIVFIFFFSFTNKSIPLAEDSVPTREVLLGNSPENLHVKGAPLSEAEVILIEFSDFECPACAGFSYVGAGLTEKYQNLALVYRHFPLSTIHPMALLAARASEAAAEQGKFWEYHDILFFNQDAFSKEDFKRYARESGLNLDQFNAYIDSQESLDKVNTDIQLADRLGLTSTPTIYMIQGENVSIIRDYSELDAKLGEILKIKTTKP